MARTTKETPNLYPFRELMRFVVDDRINDEAGQCELVRMMLKVGAKTRLG